METELDVFPHQELNQTPINPRNNLDIISSWLDLDEIYIPSLPQELHDLQMLDDHLFNFTNPNFHNDQLSLIPDSAFVDLYEFDPRPSSESADSNHPIVPEYHIEPESDDCNTFLNNNDFGLIEHVESQDCISADHVSDSTTTTMLNFSEVDSYLQTIVETDIRGSAKVGLQFDDEDDEEETDDDPRPGTMNSKNLVSERKRRKRLSQQLLALRTLVPNITKMDKRSVLVDALSYLKGIQEETARIQKEINVQRHEPRLNNYRETSLDNPAGTLRVPRKLARSTAFKPKAQIIEIDVEKIEDRRYAVKITCKGGSSVGADILRVFESLGFEITYFALEHMKPLVLATIFIRIKKHEKITEEKLRDCVTSTCLRSGMSLQYP